MVALNGMRLEVLAGVSFGPDNSTALIWEDFAMNSAIGTEVSIETDAVYALQADALDALNIALEEFAPGANTNWEKIGDSGLQPIAGMTAKPHVEYQSACLPNGLSGTALAVQYFGQPSSFGAKVQFANPMVGTVMRFIYFVPIES